MIHDCNLALGYTQQWQVDGGEQHRQRLCANLCASVWMRLLLVYSLGSLSFFLWASYREVRCAPRQLLQRASLLLCSAFLITRSCPSSSSRTPVPALRYCFFNSVR